MPKSKLFLPETLPFTSVFITKQLHKNGKHTVTHNHTTSYICTRFLPYFRPKDFIFKTTTVQSVNGNQKESNTPYLKTLC